MNFRYTFGVTNSKARLFYVRTRIAYTIDTRLQSITPKEKVILSIKKIIKTSKQILIFFFFQKVWSVWK